VAEKFNPVSEKYRFINRGCNSIVLKCLQDEVNIPLVFLYGVEEDCDIILINNTDLADVFSKDIVHEPLETGWYIVKTLRYKCPFI
jgi:hypothetical protein